MRTFLAIVYMFSASFLPMDEYGLKGQKQIVYDSTQVNFELGLEIFDLITIYGGESTKQIKEKDLNFNPYYQNYYCGLDAHYTFNDALKLSAGLYRCCSHPLYTWNNNSGYFDEAQFKIYLQAEGKIKIF